MLICPVLCHHELSLPLLLLLSLQTPVNNRGAGTGMLATFQRFPPPGAWSTSCRFFVANTSGASSIAISLSRLVAKVRPHGFFALSAQRELKAIWRTSRLHFSACRYAPLRYGPLYDEDQQGFAFKRRADYMRSHNAIRRFAVNHSAPFPSQRPHGVPYVGRSAAAHRVISVRTGLRMICDLSVRPEQCARGKTAGVAYRRQGAAHGIHFCPASSTACISASTSFAEGSSRTADGDGSQHHFSPDGTAVSEPS